MHRRYAAAAAAADAPVAPASAPSPPAAESVGELSEKKHRRVNRPPCLPSQDGDVVEGSVADEYTPCRNQAGIPESALWFFFRKRRSDLSKPDPAPRAAYCKIAGCGHMCHVTHSSGTKALQAHLATHGWDKDALGAEVRARKGAGLPPRVNPEAHFPLPSRKERATRAQEAREVQAARAMDQAAQNMGTQSSEGGVIRTQVSAEVAALLDQAWVAKVVVGDLRVTTLAESIGMHSFFSDDLFPSVQAQLSWGPPSHQTQSNITQENYALMKERLAAQMARVDRHEIVLHVDAWEDQWHRHYLGGIAEWINDETGKRESRLVCFERLEVWADSLEGLTARQAQTSATAVQNSWTTELQLGDLPIWLSTDNCPAAVAVANCLQIASVRCGVHLLAIIVRHLLWIPQGKEVAKELSLADPMEKLRAIGLHFYKQEEHQEL